jgi:hypothetical protein
LWPLLAAQVALVAKQVTDWLGKDCKEMVKDAAAILEHNMFQVRCLPVAQRLHWLLVGCCDFAL